MIPFKTVEHQPNFPNEDLTEGNVPLVEHFLFEHAEAKAHARYLEDSMRPLHLTGHYALEQAGITLRYDPAEYSAFCNGFAAFEYVSLVVNPRFIREQLIVKNAQRLLTSLEAIPELELSEGREAWMNAYPNVNDVLIENGVRSGESMAQLQARAMGAQIACELQKAA